MDFIKNQLRKALMALQWPLTKNLRYDLQTEKILRGLLSKQMSCVDVGAHKGEIIDLLQKFAPNGVHFAFEPIPSLYKKLRERANDRLVVYPYALSNKEGQTSFHLVKSDPAYSGIKQRQYKNSKPDLEIIDVEVRQLKHVLPADRAPIGLIKIDVEGGELDVMKGADDILRLDKPHVIFECGKGASEFYDNTPEMVFDFLDDLDYCIYSLKSFIEKQSSYSRIGFADTFQKGDEYYFIAAPSTKC